MSKYLSLHFHKFMKSSSNLNFFVNQRKLTPVNPFIKGKGSMDLGTEIIRGKKDNVEDQNSCFTASSVLVPESNR